MPSIISLCFCPNILYEGRGARWLRLQKQPTPGSASCTWCGRSSIPDNILQKDHSQVLGSLFLYPLIKYLCNPIRHCYLYSDPKIRSKSQLFYFFFFLFFFFQKWVLPYQFKKAQHRKLGLNELNSAPGSPLLSYLLASSFSSFHLSSEFISLWSQNLGWTHFHTKN